ncbi:hypothetical protein B14911_24865 [Bacillus sp. NRRL B-14911]|nr:hypothetical protein B14911_24865 [Bacillus sp. NRRL B-14911]
MEWKYFWKALVPIRDDMVFLLIGCLSFVSRESLEYMQNTIKAS